MMTQPTAVVVQEPADEAISASAKLAQYLNQQVEDFAQTEDEIKGSSAEAPLPVEEMAIACDETAQHGEQPDTTAPFKFDNAALSGFRIAYRQDAAASAEKTRTAGALATQKILQMAGWIQSMKSRLSRKEFGVFIKGLLQWVGEEARKYLDIARAFDGFDLSRLQYLEPFTILKLRSKKYAPIIERLQTHRDITPNLVQDLIKELLTKPTRKKPSEPISGWKQSRSGGGRYYNLHLHDESTGLSIQQQAEIEGILPQDVIAEAVALRAQHKSAIQTDNYCAAQTEEQQMLDDVRSRNTTAYDGSLLPQNISKVEEFPKGEDEIAPGDLEARVEDIDSEQTGEDGVEVTKATDLSKLTLEVSAQPLEAIEETCSNAIPQAVELSEPVVEMTHFQVVEDLSPASKQPLVADSNVLKQLRDAESSLRQIDTQIQTINSKLANPDSGEIVKRELSPVLQKQQNQRSAKISGIVELIANGGISAHYEEQHNIGRVVLEPKYASAALLQAKSWFEVVLVVGGSSTQLIKAIQSWSMESKQLLAQLLSEYLEEPNAFKQIDWIPEDLLLLALAKLSFQLQRFKKTDNLVDEPEIEYLTGCQLSSFSHLGTRREQWVFLFDGNLIPVFGRDELLVEKF